jgi:tRNA (cytidine/uridine-2'-O-)-methyltransferase
LEVALFEPRIPQNTGNIARSCAAFNLPLNLIEPLGFKIEDKYLRRAGLDYWPLVTVNQYSNFEKFLESKPTKRITKISKDNWLAINGSAIKIDEISMEIAT